MEIRLSPELEALVQRDVASGRYASAEEYVAEAVELLHEREAWLGETLEQHRSRLMASLEEAHRGDVFTEEEVRQYMREKKAMRASRQPAA